MTDKLLKKLATVSIFFMLLVVCISVISDEDSYSSVMAVEGVSVQALQREISTPVPTQAPVVIKVPSFEVMSNGHMLVDSDQWESIKSDFKGNAQIIIPKSTGAVINIEEQPLTRGLRIIIDNSSNSEYSPDVIQRVSDGQYFMGNTSDSYINDVVRKMSINRISSTLYSGLFTYAIDLSFDNIFVPEMHEYDDVYCIDLRKPRDVYKHIIVIDAGHGGKDAGCNSNDLKHYEKNFTVLIAEKLKKKLDKTSIKVYYTRLNDSTVYLRPRVELANELDADMFVSIHCNYYDRYWSYNVHGSEALYSSVCKGKKSLSRKLASCILDNLTNATGLVRRDVVDRKSELYILKKSNVPSTIVETAYMSNESDMEYLVNNKKINKVVKGMFNGIIQSYEELYGVKIASE